MNEWPFISIHICERTGKELPESVMLITRFTRVTPWHLTSLNHLAIYNIIKCIFNTFRCTLQGNIHIGLLMFRTSQKVKRMFDSIIYDYRHINQKVINPFTKRNTLLCDMICSCIPLYYKVNISSRFSRFPRKYEINVSSLMVVDN